VKSKQRGQFRPKNRFLFKEATLLFTEKEKKKAGYLK
jgi:hypothetical protein